MALLAMATEALLRWRVAPNDYLFRRAELFQQRPTRDAAFGDSHIMRGLTGMPGMVNFAQGSDSIFDVSAKITAYYQDVREPGFRVILQASPQMFARGAAAPSDRTKLYVSDDLSALYFTRQHFRGQLLDLWLTALTNPRFKNRRVFAQDGAELDHDRWTNRGAAAAASSAIAEIESQRPATGFASSAVAQEYVKIAGFLRARGGIVCVLTTPVAREYASRVAGDPDFVAVRRWFDDYARENGFSRVDLFDNDIPSDLFSNADHMNDAGARYLGPLVYNACFDGAEGRHEAAETLGGRIDG